MSVCWRGGSDTHCRRSDGPGIPEARPTCSARLCWSLAWRRWCRPWAYMADRRPFAYRPGHSFAAVASMLAITRTPARGEPCCVPSSGRSSSRGGWILAGTSVQPAAALLPASRDRHGDQGHRRIPAARRGALGWWRGPNCPGLRLTSERWAPGSPLLIILIICLSASHRTVERLRAGQGLPMKFACGDDR
jgi:hypothetical protein